MAPAFGRPRTLGNQLSRSLLVLVAFVVAAGSLLLQGGTLGWVVKRLRFPSPDEAAETQERETLAGELARAADTVLDDPATTATYGAAMVAGMRERIAVSRDSDRLARAGQLVDQVFDAQRDYILDARREGVYSTEALAAALRRVDAMQLGLGITRRSRIADDD